MLLWALDFLLTAASDCADAGEPTPTRNLWRLRKQTMESSAADTKEHVVDVAVDVNDNDTKGCYLILIDFAQYFAA